jgi:hypothetical protein
VAPLSSRNTGTKRAAEETPATGPEDEARAAKRHATEQAAAPGAGHVGLGDHPKPDVAPLECDPGRPGVEPADKPNQVAAAAGEVARGQALQAGGTGNPDAATDVIATL